MFGRTKKNLKTNWETKCKLYQIPKYLKDSQSSKPTFDNIDKEKIELNQYKFEDFINYGYPLYLLDKNVNISQIKKIDQQLEANIIPIGNFMASILESLFRDYCRIPKSYSQKIIKDVKISNTSALKKHLKDLLNTNKEEFVKLIFNEIDGTKNMEHFLQQLFNFIFQKDYIENKKKDKYLSFYFQLFSKIGYKRGYFRIFAEVLIEVEIDDDEKKFLKNAIETSENLNNLCFHVFLWSNITENQIKL